MSSIRIVLALYNGEKYIKEQIESILASTYSQWILEVCDDGSTDGSLDIVREFVNQYPDNIFLHENEQNQGLVLNFLSGVKRAREDYIMFCDQDDVWLPIKLEHSLKCMKAMEKKYGQRLPLAVFTDAIVVDEKKQERSPSFFQSSHLDVRKRDFSHMLMENKLIGCTVMMNQRVVDYLNILPDNARYHDWWIGLIASCFGRIGYLNEGTLWYRQHENNMVGNLSFKDYVLERVGSLGKQRAALVDTQRQAENFYEIFKEQLTAEKKEIMEAFITLKGCSPWKRRYRLVRYGFLKTGYFRNMGLFVLI